MRLLRCRYPYNFDRELVDVTLAYLTLYYVFKQPDIYVLYHFKNNLERCTRRILIIYLYIRGLVAAYIRLQCFRYMWLLKNMLYLLYIVRVTQYLLRKYIDNVVGVSFHINKDNSIRTPKVVIFENFYSCFEKDMTNTNNIKTRLLKKIY